VISFTFYWKFFLCLFSQMFLCLFLEMFRCLFSNLDGSVHNPQQSFEVLNKEL
jgi:hypothetical protein